MKVMVVKTTIYKAAICLLTGQKFKSRREKKIVTDLGIFLTFQTVCSQT